MSCFKVKLVKLTHLLFEIANITLSYLRVHASLRVVKMFTQHAVKAWMRCFMPGLRYDEEVDDCHHDFVLVLVCVQYDEDGRRKLSWLTTNHLNQWFPTFFNTFLPCMFLKLFYFSL